MVTSVEAWRRLASLSHLTSHYMYIFTPNNKSCLTTAATMMPIPATFSPESSSLSSVPTSLTAHEEMESNVRKKLASYQQTGINDPVVTILENFVQYLPRDGTQNISNDILDCDSDEKLRKLANHLLTAVLVPSEYPLLFIHYYVPVARQFCLVLHFHSESAWQDANSFAVTAVWSGR